VIPTSDKLDSKCPEGIQGTKEVADRAGEAVKLPNDHYIEEPFVRVRHEIVESGS
jgi:hypothetical protein